MARSRTMSRSVEDIEDLLSIQQVEFKVLSADDVLGKAAELRTLVDRLKNRAGVPGATMPCSSTWSTSRKIAGDIRENQLVPDKVVFRHDAFWTSHFGGCYVFVDEKHDDRDLRSECARASAARVRGRSAICRIRRRARSVYRFLAETGRIDPPRASWLETSGFLEHRAEMAIRALLREAEPGAILNRMDAVWLQTWMHRNAAR